MSKVVSKRSLGTEQREGIKSALTNLGISIKGLSDESLAALYKRYYYNDADWYMEESAESADEIL